jgi:hypothetical protein
MRKKGVNSVKRAGKAAIPPDAVMVSPLGVESQSVPLLKLRAGRTKKSRRNPAKTSNALLGVSRIGSLKPPPCGIMFPCRMKPRPNSSVANLMNCWQPQPS